MKLLSRLSVRAVAILLAGFVALQLLIVLATALPSRGDTQRPYGLPRPREVAAMVDAVERAPASERAALVHAFDQGLYSVGLSGEGVTPSEHTTTEDLVLLGRYYGAMLPGRAVAVDAERPILGALLGSRRRPARVAAPVTIRVSLDDGSALILSSRPSEAMRAHQRRRALFAAVGGLILLGILLVAMRQTMRPVSRLAEGVRRFAAGSEVADLPVEGTREVRDLASAFNDMKRRIAGLMAERTRTLAAIAHDMRTYLTRLRLRLDYIADPDHRERAARDLEEMAVLLEDTLVLARADAEAGEGETAPEIDLCELIEGAVAVRDAAPGSLVVNLPADPVLVHARPLAVRRILGNLLDNGLRYGTCVEVALSVREGKAVLTVADNGPGVSPEALARLGEPFHRGDPSRNRETGGAGLGLAIVRALAARDGATVTFENRSGHGLMVTVRYSLGDADA